MSKDGQLFWSHGKQEKEERMTKILSQDDREDGDDINQERELKRQSRFENKEKEVCGTSETSGHLWLEVQSWSPRG